MYDAPKPQHLEQAEENSRKAMELDPNLPEAYTALGVAFSLAKNHDESHKAFETAIRLGPNRFESYYMYARDCFVQGQLERAAELFERASEVAPDDYQSPLLVAQVYEALGLIAEMEAARRRGVAIAERTLRVNPGDVRALYMGANGLVALGQRERGLEWAQLALDLEPGEAMVLYNIGCIRSLAGQADDAIDCLERAVQAGLTQRGWYEHDSNLDPLRRHPRFTALMERL
jgi:adenylate cyclase